MITPRLTNCDSCTGIATLLSDINCKVANIATSYYNNITLMLDYPMKDSVMFDLLSYQRILTYKSYNEDYASIFSIEQIASKVKILKFK